MVEALTIESDGQDEWIDMEVIQKIADIDNFRQVLAMIEKIPAKDIVGKVREAGLVGLGGAAFHPC
ncbi:MAG: hypothetical protein U5N58_08045 [Actinomycetota bacterium]|nr:hypothetical protein [Actinomycetota bacterium]